MNYADAFQDVASQIPKVPDFIISSAFNRTVRRFCEHSTIYRYDQNNIDIVAGTQEYTLSLPTSTMVNEIHLVMMLEGSNHHRLQPVTRKWITNELDTQVYQTAVPRFYEHTVGPSFSLWAKPISSVTGGLNVQVSLKPTRDATTMPDWLADRYIEGLVAGAVAEISRIPDTEFYNRHLFSTMEAYFNLAIDEASKDASGADKNVPRKVKYGGIHNSGRRRKYGGYS